MNQSSNLSHPDRFATAIARFDTENSQDPNHLEYNGRRMPHELVYTQWLTDWVLRLAPNASEPLRLAARCAHLRRWAIMRESYPATRSGYLRWRADLKKYHAELAGKMLREAGYDDTTIARVQSLVSKSAFPQEPESRTLEDALCLVFLEHQFADLASKSADEKMINALKKTWQKMTPPAREIALKLAYGPRETRLLNRALKGDGSSSSQQKNEPGF